MCVFVSVKRVRVEKAKITVTAIQARMEIEESYMYPPGHNKLCEDSTAHMSQTPFEHEQMVDFSVPQQQKTDQVVPEQRKEDEKRQRLRLLSTWRYHCEVANAKVTDKKSKLTEAAKLLSAEEMQLLDEDIFNPLDIAWIISKNSETTTEN
ncbi:hypothetical protein ACROYT_G030376 [Oculina patagonica]